jgi:hypothetical protein
MWVGYVIDTIHLLQAIRSENDLVTYYVPLAFGKVVAKTQIGAALPGIRTVGCNFTSSNERLSRREGLASRGIARKGDRANRLNFEKEGFQVTTSTLL